MATLPRRYLGLIPGLCRRLGSPVHRDTCRIGLETALKLELDSLGPGGETVLGLLR